MRSGGSEYYIPMRVGGVLEHHCSRVAGPEMIINLYNACDMIAQQLLSKCIATTVKLNA